MRDVREDGNTDELHGGFGGSLERDQKKTEEEDCMHVFNSFKQSYGFDGQRVTTSCCPVFSHRREEKTS